MPTGDRGRLVLRLDTSVERPDQVVVVIIADWPMGDLVQGLGKSSEVGMKTTGTTRRFGMISFEGDNIRAYVLLLRIEITLREALRAIYEAELGSHWQKRLPGDLLTKIRASQAEEHRPQFGFVRLGPLYYLTLGELLILLQQKPGKGLAIRLGGDVFVKQLESVLSPRNALAHSRPVPQAALGAIETLYAGMVTALTPDEVQRLTAAPDVGMTQSEAVGHLQAAVSIVRAQVCSRSPALEVAEVFDVVERQFWWADPILAGFDPAFVEKALGLIVGYNALPKGIGTDWVRQKYCDDHGMLEQLDRTLYELQRLKA